MKGRVITPQQAGRLMVAQTHVVVIGTTRFAEHRALFVGLDSGIIQWVAGPPGDIIVALFPNDEAGWERFVRAAYEVDPEREIRGDGDGGGRLNVIFLNTTRETAFTPDLEQAYARVYYALEDLGLM